MSSESADPKTQSEVNAIVVGEIASDKLWRVRFNGAIWYALLSQTSSKTSFLPGESVRVVGMKGITLLVQPLSDPLKSNVAKADSSVVTRTSLGEAVQMNEGLFQKDSDNTRSSLTRFEKVSEKGDRMIAFASGGAFLGGLIAQIPGAVAGALAGAIFGWFDKKSANSPENS